MKKTGADLVVRALEDEGIPFTFGIPGTHNIELYDELAGSDSVQAVLVTDEADLGVSYGTADLILYHLVTGRSAEWIVSAGFDADAVARVQGRMDGTHWKRNLPTVAMLSATTIGEWYLRPVDY